MILGLTGCPGSGKSMVARTLGGYGWRLVDADEIGREVVEQDDAVIRTLADTFGGDIIARDGTLNRRLLAMRAFDSPGATEKLNRTVHSELIARLRARIRDQRQLKEYTVIDCALIFEWNIEAEFDFTVCIQADHERRVARLLSRDGRSRAVIEGLFAAQLPQEEKVRRADLVIANNGSLERLETFAGLLALLPNVLPGSTVFD